MKLIGQILTLCFLIGCSAEKEIPPLSSPEAFVEENIKFPDGDGWKVDITYTDYPEPGRANVVGDSRHPSGAKQNWIVTAEYKGEKWEVAHIHYGPTNQRTPFADPQSKEVSAAEYGDKWPFTVGSGTIRYIEPQKVVFSTSTGATYALNGAAQKEYAAVDPIWLDNPKIPGAKVSLSPFIQLGLELGKK